MVIGIWDGFPVSPGHALLIPKRHVATWFDATGEEQQALLAGVEAARAEIERDHQPDGYNIGINMGAAAGQTVPHLHVHLIPRYAGDVADPRGGVRYVIPLKANYLSVTPNPGDLVRDRDVTLAELEASPPTPSSAAPLTASDVANITTGASEPLLPQLCAHLDRSIAADWAVAFVLQSGVRLLRAHWIDLLERGGTLRVVTGDYMNVTEPNALLELLDLREQYSERVGLFIFETHGASSYHPKAYLFREEGGQEVAWVGSSNLTRTALKDGLEWNYRVVTSRDREGMTAVRRAFNDLLNHPNVRPLDADWVDAYRAIHDAQSKPPPQTGVVQEINAPPPEPHDIQKRALQALVATRSEGNSAGLVVLATGLGKTWLSAFDSKRPEFRRILFVAHREEILSQAMATFRRIRPEARLGLYSGKEKTPEADVLFASIQTIGRKAHLAKFGARDFDYIVVDEFHHAAARSYRGLIDYFDPKFLLGLTATPERTDGGDLLGLCQENLVFRCDLGDGIRENLLSPFHYFGVPDEVDYSNIPWRSSHFDEAALTAAVATQKRAQNALDQYREKAGARTLAFCCSKRHANFMRDFFRAANLRVAAVHSDASSDPRALSLEQLAAGELDVIFAVDMFNEGVDLPNVDTVMMLRPTESRILWLQQLGRGLRKAEGKDRLVVIDYIGNHRSFLLKPQSLFDLPLGDDHVARALERLERGELELPPGCEVTYDLETIEILKGLLRRSTGGDVVRFAYEDFRERHGARPTATELHHENYAPRSLRRTYGSWLGFVGAMGDLTPTEAKLVGSGIPSEFLAALETTQMTRSYKMLVLLAMLASDRFPGAISIAELCDRVRSIARRSVVFQRDLGISLDDEAALRRLLEENPIKAWTGGKGTGGRAHFDYSDGRFSTLFTVEESRRSEFAELVRELVEWRLAEYLSRPEVDSSPLANEFSCKVSHANGRPILFLPDREKHPDLPMGVTPVMVGERKFEANFVKTALNTMSEPGSKENALPEVLRGWFGDNAGQPGTRNSVRFMRGDEYYEMEPVGLDDSDEAPAGLQVGVSYMREQIPAGFGLKFQSTRWQQGHISINGHIFLLVTLDKSNMAQEHRYDDKFLSADLFEWKSQNRHTRHGKPGQEMQNHASLGIPVHLFVRKVGKIQQKAAPFVYCGDVDFVSWEGDKPITIRWRLHNPLTQEVAGMFEVE